MKSTKGGSPPEDVLLELERQDDDGQVITIAVHTKKEVGTGLAARILKEAGL